ncbi:MAG: histidine kinase [Urechidicola sp.]|nr:histidine kinase [Urechidicola sp.]
MRPHIQKIIVTFSFLFAMYSYSQNYQLSHFSLNDGLPQSQVNDVIQDDFGYLWVATEGGGIARFDGNHFEVFNEDDGLISNYTTSINVINKQLFIGTKKGLSIKDGDEIFSYKSPEINKIIQVGSQVCLATNEGLQYFNNLEISLKPIDTNLDKSQINDLFFDGQTLWLASEIGLYGIRNIGSDSTITKKWNDFNIVAFATDINKNLYFATKPNGVFEFNKTTGEEKKIAITKNINSMYVDSNINHLVLSTNNTEFFSVDLDLGMVKTNNISELSKLNIHKIILDTVSNQWIGSSKGLYKLSKSSFKHYLKNQTITAVHIKRDTTFVATADGGLIFIDSVGVNRIPDFHHNIYALSSNQQGQLFAGADDGILVLDSLKVVDTISFAKDIQKIILKDSVLWVTSTTQGISKFQYDFKTKELKGSIQFKKSDGLYDLSIYDAQLDDSGKFWYISNNGFLGFVKDDVVHHLGRKLPNNATIGSLVIHENKIYLATHGEGIWWANLSDNPRFKLLRGNKRLPSNNVYQLGFDAQNNMWAGLQKGVAQIKLNESNKIKDIIYFDKYDGFTGVETMLNVIAANDFGAMYFGTIHGLTKFEPAGQNPNNIKPRIHFEAIEVSYQKLDSLYQKDFSFSPNDNHLSFSFKTIDINYPKEILYRWRMNTNDWSDWSSNTSVIFASLEAGDYHFEVQSKTENEIVSDPIEFQFFIEATLVKTLWFQLLVVGVALLIVLLIVWNYLRNLKRKNKVKQAQLELENELLTLEQKALRLQMNPHFIFNVLNGIKALGLSDVKKMNVVIQKFASLMRATLLNSRQENITLEEEIKSLNYYLELEQLMGAKDFKFTIDVDKKIDIKEMMIAPMLIQPFVENAIEHGISQIEKEGNILVSFALKNKQLYCAIKDNGIGYKQSVKFKNKSSHQSVALEVTKERIDKISDKSTFKIEELKDTKGAIKGTLVSFNLPIITDY